MPLETDFKSFPKFYPFYLSEHSHSVCRRLHFLGTLSILIVLVLIPLIGRWGWLLLLPVLGYGPAWIGHFFFEKNQPATFRHPFYSLAGDLVMFRDILIGRVKW